MCVYMYLYICPCIHTYSWSSLFMGFILANFLLIKIICNHKINTCRAFAVIHRHVQSGEKFASPNAHFPGESDQVILCLLVSALRLQISVLFTVSLVPQCLHFCSFCWWFCCLKGPHDRAEVLFVVPKCKTAVIYFMEKSRMLDKLHSGMGYSAIGCEFNVNESMIYVFKSILR